MHSTNRVCDRNIFGWKGNSAYVYKLGVLMVESGLWIGRRLFLLSINERQAMLANAHRLIFLMVRSPVPGDDHNPIG